MWQALIGFLIGMQTEFWARMDALVPAPPAAILNACQEISASLGWLGPVLWVAPWPALAAGVIIVLGGVGIGVGVVVARIGVSFLTLGGGGT